MSIASYANMEEISLDDEDRNCLEYKLLMVFAQRNLSASQYGELLERHIRTGPIQLQGLGPTLPSTQGKEANGYKGGEDVKIKRERIKLTKKKSSWKQRLVPKCIKGVEPEEPRREGLEKVHILDDTQIGDAEPVKVTLIAEKLVNIIHTTSPALRKTSPCFYRSFSVEPDGGVDGEDKIVQDIVALLRQSGDRLNEQMNKDKTLRQSLFSYAFFKKVADCFLENLDLSGETEVQQQSVKLAYTMDVATKLTAVDNHPMNRVMGFGVKYLKEHFSPWIETHGGWEKALNILDEEEVE
ncbi:apoptosis facilitator Bcl-2-like protein 14 isoform X1 [Microcaecilia unicolor]|uniref:Apoptosis facilitator Bcl-2-like protein 14 isoform X1 n=1 Tax=Microcaecilia unicolor TaxID=1415580 RepID=A0A6P7Z2Y2_9AMPH|nr:apoptosis facilitator Bcl-2-like protein 14 isoform X1 [Microcaecilia unicolor]